MSYDPKHARFYGILDTTYVKTNQWVKKCQALHDGGADIVQLRAKKESHVEDVKPRTVQKNKSSPERSPLAIVR